MCVLFEGTLLTEAGVPSKEGREDSLMRFHKMRSSSACGKFF